MSGEILIALINNSLDGAKLEANKLELDPEMNEVMESLTKAINLFTWKAKERKVNVSLEMSRQMPELVEIDEARFS